jgi:hypothetical protein
MKSCHCANLSCRGDSDIAGACFAAILQPSLEISRLGMPGKKPHFNAPFPYEKMKLTPFISFGKGYFACLVEPVVIGKSHRSYLALLI